MSEFTSRKRLISEPDFQELVCNKCDITFGMRKSLNVHIRKFHTEEKLSLEGNQICGMCNLGFHKTSQLHGHLENKHELNLHVVNETFYAETDFQQWKMNIERENQASFVCKSKKENKETFTKFTYYKCHRSGVPTFKVDRKRRIKDSGSIKIGSTCPAMIKVISQTIGDVTEMKVEYQSVHFGHDLIVDIDVNKGRIAIEKDAVVAFLHKPKMNHESRKIKILNDLSELHKRFQDFDSGEVYQFMEQQIEVMNVYLDTSVPSTSSSLPELYDVSKVPPNKHIDQQRKFTIKKKSRKQGKRT